MWPFFLQLHTLDLNRQSFAVIRMMSPFASVAGCCRSIRCAVGRTDTVFSRCRGAMDIQRCVQRSGVLLCCLVQLCHLEGFLKRQFRHLEQAALHVVVSDSANEPVSDEFLSRISVLAVRSQVSQTCHKRCHGLAPLPHTRIKSCSCAI